jgi:hypothetical protein
MRRRGAHDGGVIRRNEGVLLFKLDRFRRRCVLLSSWRFFWRTFSRRLGYKAYLPGSAMGLDGRAAIGV